MAASSRSRLQNALEPLDAVGELLLGGGEPPAHEAIAVSADRRPGREPEADVAHELLAEGEAVRHPVDLKEDVHRARRHSDFYPRHLAKLIDEKFPRPAV